MAQRMRKDLCLNCIESRSTESSLEFFTLMLCFIPQSCPTLFDTMDCNLPGSPVHRDSPGKNTEVSCLGLLQGIFPTQGSNPGLPYQRWILYYLSHEKSPLNL